MFRQFCSDFRTSTKGAMPRGSEVDVDTLGLRMYQTWNRMVVVAVVNTEMNFYSVTVSFSK